MKIISSSSELRQKLVSGVEKLSNAMGSTLGPRGRNVLIKEKEKRPFITKDGATVASHFSLEDPVENAAAEIVKQAAKRTNIEAGDGTTTSTVLACAIFKNSAEYLEKHPQTSPVQLYRGLQGLSQEVLRHLLADAREVSSLDDIRHIATISANNDPVVGELVAMAIDKVGNEGSITIESGNTSETILDLIEGFRFDSGFASASFITDDRRRLMRYDNPMFLVTDSKLETIDQILPSLEIAAREDRPFIIVCEEIEGQALAALIMNTVRGNMKVAAVKAPGYGQSRRDALDDLALSVGAKFFRRIRGDKLSQVTLKDFGSAKSIQSTTTETIVAAGRGSSDSISERIQALKTQIEGAGVRSAKDPLQRLARLQSAVAVVKVGGNSEIEVIEKRHRVEDALEAVRSAQSEGVLAGAGTALHKYSFILDTLGFEFSNTEQEAALDILSKSFVEPARIMAHNSGMTDEDFAKLFSDPFEQHYGYDFLSGKVVDLLSTGIIDPFKVVRCCIKNAVSVAGGLLTTSVSIIEN